MNAQVQTQTPQAKKPKPASHVVTGKVRGSYVNVFTPRKNDLSGELEYSMSILIPKTDTVTLGKIKAAITFAMTDKFGPAVVASELRMPVRDGDTDKTKAGDPAYKGHYFINVRSKTPPGIVDQQRQPVLKADAFVSGDYCYVSINAFGYTTKGKGISFGLNNIQIVERGEPLSARSRAEEDFDVLEEAAGAPGAAPVFNF